MVCCRNCKASSFTTLPVFAAANFLFEIPACKQMIKVAQRRLRTDEHIMEYEGGKVLQRRMPATERPILAVLK